MLLKTLSLAGFKSFANRTRLDFGEGVNVVVGPNGTGKSNLLDALAWVLGTQATRSLRTARMEDVIFAGTATRPALGRAEVTVTLDNTGRFLAYDLDEISLTRRLYRDGTSEYELNGVPCRLLDLQELLADGGVGRHQHVLVGQGQIGDILNARPDEHRAIIEEAAGITKHRNRRDRSLRRLELTAIDVARLGDILEQERRRLRPLKKQAGDAERYDSVKTEIRALRLWIGAEELRSLRTRMATATTEKTSLDGIVTADSDELTALRNRLGTLRLAAGEVERTLERDTAAAARLETVVERFHRIGMVARERRLALHSRLEGAGERRRDLEAEHAHLTAELAAVAHQLAEASALAEHREITLRMLEDEERSLAEQIQLPAEGVVANLRGDLRALEGAAERDRRELDGVQRRREVVSARLAEERAEAETLVAEIRSTDVDAVAAQEHYEHAAATRETAQQALEECEYADRESQIAVAHAAARVEALEGALAGLGDPEVRRRTAAIEGVTGPLVAALDVPEQIAAAVDASLGTWAEALVTRGVDALTGAVTALKSEGFGGVTLVVGHTSPVEIPAREVAARCGASALVDLLGPHADQAVAGRLLGDVVLVEGWSAAWRLVERHPQVRAVTPEGDLVSVHGVRLADADGAGHAALEAARVAGELAETGAARTASRLVTARRQFETTRTAERAALDELERCEAKLAGHTEALALNGRARSEGDAEIIRLDERARALAEAGRARDERFADLRRRLADFAGEEKDRQEAWEALTRARDEVAHRRAEARRLREHAAASVAGARERHRLLAARLEAAGVELHDLDGHPVDPVEPERLAAIEAQARRADAIVRDHIAALRDRQRTLREQAGTADAELDAAHRRERELERSVSSGKDRGSALAIELAELRVRYEAVAEALRRDTDATEEVALAAPRPELDEDVDAVSHLATREAELRRMGPINPLAAAEYRDVAARVEMLDGQLADLEDSRRELRKVIAALDREMGTLFLTAFAEVSDLYQENFGLVFPGGKGRLRLSDPDHPLETGVEIDAQPLGKKIGRLSLLSGGERSLAALAFLFAVFRARPSPFYVLDEVEAALDDANLRRFIRLVETLRQSAQLVIITHQQQTMEAADIVYGVTMEPAESSKVISKRLDRAPV